MQRDPLRLLKIFGTASAAAVLAACGSLGGGGNSAVSAQGEAAAQTTTVNRYLWRASLDTIQFMPIDEADPIAGLITTDWYSNPTTPQERFKTNVYILDTALRADALRVSLFRQQLTEFGWIDVTVNDNTAREIENRILTRARELRLNSLDD